MPELVSVDIQTYLLNILSVWLNGKPNFLLLRGSLRLTKTETRFMDQRIVVLAALVTITRTELRQDRYKMGVRLSCKKTWKISRKESLKKL